MARQVMLKVRLKDGREIARKYDAQAAGLRLGWAAGLPDFVSATVVKACLLVGLALSSGCAGFGEFVKAWDATPRYGVNSRGEILQVGGEARH